MIFCKISASELSNFSKKRELLDDIWSLKSVFVRFEFQLLCRRSKEELFCDNLVGKLLSWKLLSSSLSYDDRINHAVLILYSRKLQI